LASTFIDIIIKNRQNPDFTVKKDNTMEIKEFLDKIIDADTSDKSIFLKAQTYISYSFLHYLILLNVM